MSITIEFYVRDRYVSHDTGARFHMMTSFDLTYDLDLYFAFVFYLHGHLRS